MTDLMPCSALLPTLTAVPTISWPTTHWAKAFSIGRSKSSGGSYWVESGTPATSQRVQVGAADTAMGDFDIDVRFLPRLWLVLLELQVTFHGLWVKAHPALELVVCIHGFGCCKAESRTGSRVS